MLSKRMQYSSLPKRCSTSHEMSFSREIRTSAEQRTAGSSTSTINRESVVYEDLQKWRSSDNRITGRRMEEFETYKVTQSS